MAREDAERMTPEEARAVVVLWSRRQWERQHWPTVEDVAEGLEIPVPEAEALLRAVRDREEPVRRTSAPDGFRRTGSCGLRLAAGVAGLTGFFCVFLNQLL